MLNNASIRKLTFLRLFRSDNQTSSREMNAQLTSNPPSPTRTPFGTLYLQAEHANTHINVGPNVPFPLAVTISTVLYIMCRYLLDISFHIFRMHFALFHSNFTFKRNTVMHNKWEWNIWTGIEFEKCTGLCLLNIYMAPYDDRWR